jgi:hypothetical protein
MILGNVIKNALACASPFLSLWNAGLAGLGLKIVNCWLGWGGGTPPSLVGSDFSK